MDYLRNWMEKMKKKKKQQMKLVEGDEIGAITEVAWWEDWVPTPDPVTERCFRRLMSCSHWTSEMGHCDKDAYEGACDEEPTNWVASGFFWTMSNLSLKTSTRKHAIIWESTRKNTIVLETIRISWSKTTKIPKISRWQNNWNLISQIFVTSFRLIPWE